MSTERHFASAVKRLVRQELLLWIALGVLTVSGTASGATPADPLLARTISMADEFQRSAPRLITTEALHQTSFNFPPHHLIVMSPEVEIPRFLVHDVVSEYTIGRLKGSPATQLVEIREMVSMDGNPIQTPAAARRALSEDVQAGEERVRKHLLAEFTKLKLTDVATDYGTILLAFTSAAVADLKIEPASEGFIGTEEAICLKWMQTSGGALEFRGKKVARRLLQGELWIRKSDGNPLRITAAFEHSEPLHTLRDEASIDYVVSVLGFPTPATVSHRHFIDGQAITENLYTYQPFHAFTTDTNVRYQGTEKK